MKTKLIVWLWNPWKEYENTRHNVWFKIVENISNYADGTQFLFDKKFNWEISISKDWKYMIIFLKPQTFMNLSWDSVQKIVSYYDIDNKNILVLHDELDLEEWKIKLKWNGGDNWHNWLKDITKKIWTNQYWKLKIGIWRPEHKWDITNYVLWKLQKNTYNKLLEQEEFINEYVRQFLIAN